MTIAEPFEVAAFYAFARLADLPRLRTDLQALCDSHGVKGILLIAPEGFNGTMAGAPVALASTLHGIRKITGVNDFDVKTSHAARPPFRRMKVRIKKEIVTIGDTSVDPVGQVGRYVEPEDWNALISDPEVLLIDTRNAYEVAVGTFDGAIDPGTRSFGAFPPALSAPISIQRGTGRLPCSAPAEFAAKRRPSFMLREGFDTVYHLKGGILSYLEKVPESESRWKGGCFVFDERVAVGHGLKVMPVRFCLSCNTPLDAAAMQSVGYEEGVSCPHCVDTLTEQQKSSARERQRQVEIAAKKGRHHLGRSHRKTSDFSAS